MPAIFRVKRLKSPCLTPRACFSCQRKLAETQSVRQLRGISVNLPSILNVKFKLNPRCDHLVRSFFAANLFARYCSCLPIYPTGEQKNVFAQFSQGKCCFCRL